MHAGARCSDHGHDDTRRRIWDPQHRPARDRATRSASSHPRVMARNPVMFVVEVGSVLTTRAARPRRGGRAAGPRLRAARSRSGSGSPCCSPTSPRRWPRGAARRRPTRCAAARTETVGNAAAPDGTVETVPAPSLRKGDVVLVTAGEFIPGRRRDHRGRRVGGRVGDHRRVGAGHPRVGRRPLRRDRRHAGAVRLDQGPRHRRSRPHVPRPDDRARRGRRAAEDAQRDRAQHPAGRPDDRLPARRRHAAAVRRLLAAHRSPLFVLVVAARLPDPDDDRRRCCRRSASPAWTGWCSTTCWRCPAAPSRPPATSTRCCSTRPARSRSATGRRPSSSRCRASPSGELADAAQLASLADETPEGRSIVVLAKEKYGLRGRELRRHGARRSCRSPRRRACRASTSTAARSARAPPTRSRRYVAAQRRRRARRELQADRRAHRARRRHAARRRRADAAARRRPPEGHRQGRHARALRRSCARWASRPS